MKDNKILVGLVIILSILVLGLSGYIFYDKKIKNEDNVSNHENTNVSNDANDNKEINNITNEEIKEIFDFVYNYRELPFVYCGEYKKDNTSENNEMYDYFLSTEFTTYDEMFEHLSSYMSREVISGKYAFEATNKNYYVEKDGKLYCQDSYKGYLYNQKITDIEITNEEEKVISLVGTMELTNPYDDTKVYDKVNIILEQSNDKWIVTSYEKQNEE